MYRSRQLLLKRHKVLCVSCFPQKLLHFLFFFPVSPVRLQVYVTMTPLLPLAVLPSTSIVMKKKNIYNTLLGFLTCRMCEVWSVRWIVLISLQALT